MPWQRGAEIVERWLEMAFLPLSDFLNGAASWPATSMSTNHRHLQLDKEMHSD
jgi:hypothetical protein